MHDKDMLTRTGALIASQQRLPPISLPSNMLRNRLTILQARHPCLKYDIEEILRSLGTTPNLGKTLSE